MDGSESTPPRDAPSLARLRREFLSDAAAALEDARAAARTLTGREDEDLRARLRRWAAHLEESARLHGLAALQSASGTLRVCLEPSEAFPADRVREALAALGEALARARDGYIGGASRTLPAERPEGSPGSGRIRRLLMIDDDPILRKIAKTALEKTREYAVETLASGRDAVENAAGEKTDLIILDARMPDEDGYEVCRRLKSDPRTKDIPVVFLSADDREQDRELARSAGAVGLIGKPFKPVSLSATIRNLLAQTEQS